MRASSAPEPSFLGGIGDLQNGGYPFRMTCPVRPRGVDVKSPDDYGPLASQHRHGKLFGQRAREGHDSPVRKKQTKFDIWHQHAWLLPDSGISSEAAMSQP